MKVYIISYENKKMRLDGTDRQNLGDWVQVIAMEQLLEELKIEYERVPRSRINMCETKGETIIINGWNSFDELATYEGIQMPNQIWGRRIYWGFNIEGNYIPESAVRVFKENGPIGCRDEGTLKRLEKYGIECYISGCPSALMKKRKETECQNKTFIIDVSKDAESSIPQEIKEKAVYLSNDFRLSRQNGLPYMSDEESKAAYEAAKKILQTIRNEAKLVITGRLHIAAPCLGLGIPVIVMQDCFDERFAWIDKYLPLYDKTKWSHINWCPKIVEFEKDKKILKEDFKRRLLGTTPKKREYERIKELFSQRNRADYLGTLRAGIEIIPDVIDEFTICGLALDTISFIEAVSIFRPHWKLKAVFDNDCIDIIFEGMKVKSLKKNTDSDSICFITTNKIKEAAIKQCMRNRIPYIIVDYTDIHWQRGLN